MLLCCVGDSLYMSSKMGYVNLRVALVYDHPVLILKTLYIVSQ